MKKKLAVLKINPKRIIENEELVKIKGGWVQCYCTGMGGWFSIDDPYEGQMLCAGRGWGGCR